MNHQKQLEKKKYRNWVRGGLAYKYLKEGIEELADDVVQQEHIRILSAVNHTSGVKCNQCCLRNLRPSHKSKRDAINGKNSYCPWRQANCNCLVTKKKSCPCNICDAIMEEILKSHGSAPPTPNWKNTDIQKWCSTPWEIAKCFINAPGYSDKTKAAETDTAGLLQIFINNITVRSHLSDGINKSDLLEKTLKRRNELFHSPAMEMEDNKLGECIDDIIAILEDDKELKARHSAQQAVVKLKQLKDESFTITTDSEVEVCRDALVFITSKSEELKQTIQDAKEDIGKKQTETTEAIEEKVNTALQGALEELDNRNETLYERVSQVESEVSKMKKRLEKVEDRVDKIEVVREHHEKQLEYVEAKQELQRKLINRYEDHYVKTSMCPLKLQENDININEVYVIPEIIPEDKVKPQPGKKKVQSIHSSNNSCVKSTVKYSDIFQTNHTINRKIYIVGDAGTGKSSFCKRIIQDWCTYITDYNNNYKDDDTLSLDIQEINKFEFLFFIPLYKMSKFNDMIEMVKAFTTVVTTNDMIDRIFEQESERCLIIADGLDEWTPSQNTSTLPHVNFGIPNGDRAKQATLITLSRPSATGILNMNFSEFDQKFEILGINEGLINDFIAKYLSKSTDQHLSLQDCITTVTLNFKHVEKTSLFLQQLVWMYYTGRKIGKSVSDTFCHITNVMIRWSQNRSKTKNICENPIDVAEEDKHLQLPDALQRFPSCEKKKRFIFLLGRVAFNSLTTDVTSVGSHLQTETISRVDINALTELGMLVEYNCFDPIEEQTEMAFIHQSYLEFFAAVYVSSHYNKKHYHSREIQNTDHRMTALGNLFLKCKSASDILQLSNVLKMINGLSPFLISEIAELISSIVNRDKDISMYRELLSSYLKNWEEHVSFQIERLIFNCLIGGDERDQLMVKLCDVVIDNSTEIPLLEKIIPDEVVSLKAFRVSGEDKWSSIALLKHVQYVFIWESILQHSEMVLLSSLIQEAPLKCLALIRVQCALTDCEGHIIDLSKNDQLQRLELINCGDVKIKKINTKRLELLRLVYACYDVMNVHCILNANCLKELYIKKSVDDFYVYGERANVLVHTLPKLRKLSLQKIEVDSNALTVNDRMENLECIELVDVRMNQGTWKNFLDSLFTLQQSVQVDTDVCSVCNEIDEGGDGDRRTYVKQNETKFELISDDESNFKFKTKK